MSNESKDMSRLAVDKKLKEEVLQKLHEKFGFSQKAIMMLCISVAVRNDLEPLKSSNPDPNWHAESSEPQYQLIRALFDTDTPVRLAGELANAGLSHLSKKFSNDPELDEVTLFELE